jgi:hypothetical protein
MDKQELIDGYGEDFVEEVFEYLVELRDSGETNMFGASSYIEAEFELRRKEGGPFLGAWMDSFKEAN